ncbi:MAG: alanine:cation symporter family protein, partial [Bacteroidota bacterium]
MKKFVLALMASLILPLISFAQEAEAQATSSIDDAINSVFAPVTQVVETIIFFTVPIAGFDIPFVLIWLIVGATVFTIYMGFVQFKAFRHAIDVVRGKYDDPDDQGEVSHFQALTAALSGTVGVGNIAGVALAVGIGGPGATFWMILAGLLGMASKYTEVSLGLMYRNINPDGTVSGGPMYYLDKGLKEKGANWGVLGKVLAILFAVACIGGSFGGGNMVQINQATNQLITVSGGDYKSDNVTSIALTYQGEETTLGEIAAVKQISNGEIEITPRNNADIALLSQAISGADETVEVSEKDGTILANRNVSPFAGQGWIFGLVMAVLIGITIIGGIKSIVKVTDKIVPFMVGIYILGALIVLGAHFTEIPAAFGTIINGAFAPGALYGGIAGVLIQGFRRAAFSNEAGVGSASIAHAAAKTDEPISEGVVALLEP